VAVVGAIVYGVTRPGRTDEISKPPAKHFLFAGSLRSLMADLTLDKHRLQEVIAKKL